MDGLRVIENELVPVYVTDSGNKVVDRRELHAALQSKQDFSTWVKKRLGECDAVEGVDFDRFHKKMEANNATIIEYTIKLETAKEMAMLERNAKGKQVRRYFIKVDEKYKEEKALPLTLQQQIQTIAKGTDELYQKVGEVEKSVSAVKDEMAEIKDNLPLLPLEADNITTAVRKRGTEALGGYKSNAYNDRGLRQKVYNDIYADLKRNFDNIKTYKAIRRKDSAKAVQIVEEYRLPFCLAERVKHTNAQQSFGLEGGACV